MAQKKAANQTPVQRDEKAQKSDSVRQKARAHEHQSAQGSTGQRSKHDR
ncbi:hypothetical protein [Hydrocarboniphaga effusa]|jgi:hypothetical protein